MKMPNPFHLFYLLIFLLFFENCKTEEPDFKLDHFKVWQIDTIESEESVTLIDQFFPRPRNGKVTHLIWWANPTRKDTFKIKNSNAHLAGYKIEVDGMERSIRVRLENQFGKQRWLISKPTILLVPTEKVEPNSSFPSSLDHFLCYEIFPRELGTIDIEMEDQYDIRNNNKESITAIIPRYFCVPVEKNGEARQNEEEHLTWYGIFPQTDFETKDSIVNQFDTLRITSDSSRAILVPTEKLGWFFDDI